MNSSGIYLYYTNIGWMILYHSVNRLGDRVVNRVLSHGFHHLRTAVEYAKYWRNIEEVYDWPIRIDRGSYHCQRRYEKSVDAKEA